MRVGNLYTVEHQNPEKRQIHLLEQQLNEIAQRSFVAISNRPIGVDLPAQAAGSRVTWND